MSTFWQLDACFLSPLGKHTFCGRSVGRPGLRVAMPKAQSLALLCLAVRPRSHAAGLSPTRCASEAPLCKNVTPIRPDTCAALRYAPSVELHLFPAS
ncbi:hypothetical protein NDU88_001799 [Pleurodeles waltl]|uniref:Uncharacterized protein n=1 Tax=Pleurodeles waltl TaxID=8319 RepID=A0AAV7WJF3_PLEWA|nr:hypothetical protein NDU88_001799 [Pleurodeles waltl]